MTNSTWDESEHPRDNEGKFTYKNGGSTPSHEKHVSEMQRRADILYPTMKDKNGKSTGGATDIKEKLISNLKNDIRMTEHFLHSKNMSEQGSIEEIHNKLKQSIEAIVDFGKNYYDIRKANTQEADKYFHAKANCQAAQHGKFGADMARKLSDKREDFDLIKNKYKPKRDGTRMTKEEIKKDYLEDQEANVYGRAQGLKNPDVDCRILVDKYRPNGLNEGY